MTLKDVMKAVSVLIVLTGAMFVFLAGGGKFLDSLGATLLIHIPLMISYLVFIMGDRKAQKFIFPPSLMAFSANLLLSLALLVLYAIELYDKGRLGPAHGYWLLFAWAGGVKLSGVGIIAGLLLSKVVVDIRQYRARAMNSRR